MMQKEYDFSNGERSKFYSPEAVFSFPVYLEPDVDEFMNRLAEEKGVDIQKLIKDWLRTTIKLIQSVQQSN